MYNLVMLFDDTVFFLVINPLIIHWVDVKIFILWGVTLYFPAYVIKH